VDEQGLGRRATDEAVLAAVYILVMAAGAVVLQLVQRKAAEPDLARVWRMRAAKSGERFCAASAANWWRQAERFRLAYEAERGV
jgi:hypothetical protein